jgi:hypothetical protein
VWGADRHLGTQGLRVRPYTPAPLTGHGGVDAQVLPAGQAQRPPRLSPASPTLPTISGARRPDAPRLLPSQAAARGSAQGPSGAPCGPRAHPSGHAMRPCRAHATPMPCSPDTVEWTHRSFRLDRSRTIIDLKPGAVFFTPKFFVAGAEHIGECTQARLACRMPQRVEFSYDSRTRRPSPDTVGWTQRFFRLDRPSARMGGAESPRYFERYATRSFSSCSTCAPEPAVGQIGGWIGRRLAWPAAGGRSPPCVHAPPGPPAPPLYCTHARPATCWASAPTDWAASAQLPPSFRPPSPSPAPCACSTRACRPRGGPAGSW